MPTSTSPHPPSPFEACLASIARGAAAFAALGVAFHAVGGSTVRAMGRATLTPQHIAAEAARAGARLAAVAGGYTALRCALQQTLPGSRSDALACAAAGAAAVAVPTLRDPRRVRLLREVFGNALAGAGRGGARGGGGGAEAVPLHLIGASAAFSGAIVLGGSDVLLHRVFGLRW